MNINIEIDYKFYPKQLEELKEYLIDEDFFGFYIRGKFAPGIVIANRMIKLILENMKKDNLDTKKIKAISETDFCAPDSITAYLKLTIGNRYLIVKNWGIFALSIFELKTGIGYRASMPIKNIENYPEIYRWFMRKVSKQERTDKDARWQMGVRVLKEFLPNYEKILKIEKIKVTDETLIGKAPIKNTIICDNCNETFVGEGTLCPKCKLNFYEYL